METFITHTTENYEHITLNLVKMVKIISFFFVEFITII
jgi:hypothetical protein